MPKRGIHLRNLDIEPLDVFQGELAYASARYYAGHPSAAGAIEQSSIDDNLRCGPMFIARDIQIDRIGIHVLTAQATGSTRLGIYEPGDDGLPGRLLIDAGTVDTSTSGFKEITVDVVLRGPRVYWGAYVHNVDSIGLRVRSNFTSLGFGSGGDVNPDTGVNLTHAFGVLPDPHGGGSIGENFSYNAFYMRVV